MHGTGKPALRRWTQAQRALGHGAFHHGLPAAPIKQLSSCGNLANAAACRQVCWTSTAGPQSFEYNKWLSWPPVWHASPFAPCFYLSDILHDSMIYIFTSVTCTPSPHTVVGRLRMPHCDTAWYGGGRQLSGYPSYPWWALIAMHTTCCTVVNTDRAETERRSRRAGASAHVTTNLTSDHKVINYQLVCWTYIVAGGPVREVDGLAAEGGKAESHCHEVTCVGNPQEASIANQVAQEWPSHYVASIKDRGLQ